MPIWRRTRDLSLRYPDVSIYCGRDGPEDDDRKAFDDPRIVFEVLSAGTARTGLRIKLDEYEELPGIDEPHDVALPAVGLVLPHAEVFARD